MNKFSRTIILFILMLLLLLLSKQPEQTGVKYSFDRCQK